MKQRPYLPTIFIFLFAFRAWAQPSVTEKYNALVNAGLYDSALVLINESLIEFPNDPVLLAHQGDAYLYKLDYEKSLRALEHAISVAHDTANYFKAEQYLLIAYSYHDLSDHRLSLEYANVAQALLPESKLSGYRDMLFHKSLCFDKLGLADSSLYYLNKLVKAEILAGDSTSVASTMNSIGYWYASQKEYPKALEFYRIAETYKEKMSHTTLPTLYNNYGILYLDMKIYDSAEYYLKKGLELFETNRDTMNIAKRHLNFGLFYTQTKDFEKAQKSFAIAQSTFEKYGAKNLICRLEILKSKLYLKMNQPTEAIATLKAQIKTSRNEGMYTLQKRALLALVGAYETTNDFKSAFETQKRIAELEQELKTGNPLLQIKDTEITYQIEQKKKALALQAANHQLTLTTQRKTFLIYAIVGAFVLFTILLYFYFQKQRLRLQKELLNQEIDGLRLRIGNIMSEIKLDEVKLDHSRLKNDLPNSLTDREIEILQVAITNKTNAEIADEVHLSVNTVKYHLKNIYTKIGVSSRLEAREALSNNN